jgi:hypothetical protein
MKFTPPAWSTSLPPSHHLVTWLQLLRWSPPASNQGTQEVPFITVTISSKRDLTGLLAALAALYNSEDLFRQVPQQDLVSAVVYGDQLAIPRAVELGMQLLKEAAAGEGGINQGCCKALADVPIWPTCMLPLLPLMAAQYGPQAAASEQQQYHSVLLSALGNLEAVWKDQQLQELLLALSLPAVELLLSSDQLRVVSEDTVLYTAVRYVEHLDSIQGRDAAKETLSKCIRCVYLSQYSLLAHATMADNPVFSKDQQKLLLGVLSLRQVSRELCMAELSDRSHDNTAFPAAWLLTLRAHLVPASPVSLTWRVPVADIREACRKAASTGNTQQFLNSSSRTAPIGGADFDLRLQLKHSAAGAGVPGPGVQVGVYATHKHFCGPYLSLPFTMTAAAVAGGVAGAPVMTHTTSSFRFPSYGWQDFFGMPPMGGDGWDEAAWAARGLPVEGHIELHLTVKPLVS